MASKLLPETPQQTAPSAATQLANLVIAVILVDPAGAIAEVNSAAENLLGTSAIRLVGKPFDSIVRALDGRVSDRLSDLRQAVVAHNVRVRIGNTETSVNLTMSAVPAHEGWRVFTISRRGHEDSSAEGDSNTALAAPSILAHEIKNPLSAIRGAAQLIARKLPHGDKSLSRMITDEVDRIARLIDRMQQLGSSHCEPMSPCNPHEAIRSAIATVRTAGLNGAVVVEEFDPSIPLMLANRDALEQVLINLLSNARDAATAARVAGGADPEITISTRYVSGHVFNAVRLGRTVRLPIEITISDNGAGVDPKLRERVFEPFVSSKSSGQGLGLALVRKLMRDMQGSISHDRDTRAGLTHFRIHFPLASEHVS